MPPPLRDNQDEMQDLLLRELELNVANFRKFDWLSSANILREITFTLLPEVHEGKINSYGVLFVESLVDLDNIEIMQFSEDQLPLARKLADGDDYFVLYEKNVFYGLAHFKTPLITEVQFVRNFPVSGGLIIQRSATGVTKFFQGDSLSIHDNRRWFTKPNVKTAAWKVSQCVANIDKSIVSSI